MRSLRVRGSRGLEARAALVLVIAALATVAGALRFDEALGLLDFRADRNAALTYLERVYGDDGVVANRAVVEDADALMPADAAYAVVVGPRPIRGESRFTRAMVADFLRYFLLPRRQVPVEAADWVFCYGCDRAALERFRLVSGGGGVAFGRRRS